MERAQIDKIVESDFTVSIRNTPQPLVITEETSVPEEYWKPQPAKLDRKRLLECVKSGQQIAGVCLGNGGRTISVRVK